MNLIGAVQPESVNFSRVLPVTSDQFGSAAALGSFLPTARAACSGRVATCLPGLDFLIGCDETRRPMKLIKGVAVTPGKLVAEEGTGKLLGAHVPADEARGVIQTATLPVKFGLRARAGGPDTRERCIQALLLRVLK